MKKFLCIILSLAMIVSLSVTAFAAEAKNKPFSITVNEYDIYVESRNSTSKMLAQNAVPEETAKIINSNAIENWLTELSLLSTEELSNMGYNTNQIDIIKNYSGERIESNPELRGVFAELTATFYKVSASTTSLTVRVNWRWSNSPALSGSAIKDMPAIRWQGTNNAGQPINLALNASSSSVIYQYYSQYTGQPEVYQYSGTATVKSDNPYGHAYAYVQMGAGSGANIDYYAKTGSFTLKIDRTGTDLINEAAFVFAYGHPIVTVTPSLSLPASFGINFSWGVEKMCELAIRMTSSGVITEY